MTVDPVNVSYFYNTVPLLQTLLRSESATFVRGKLKNFLPAWKELTSDQEILLIVKEIELEFAESGLPFPTCAQPNLKESDVLSLIVK